MKKVFEIRWHGRGGLGAKTAALLLGEALIQKGKYVQAFPEYGPERRGAPVKSYNRISDTPINVHSGITNPDIVVVLDPSFMASPDIYQGLDREKGKIIVNSELTPEELREKFNMDGYNLYTVNASGISREILGRNLPNTPMLGAVIRVTGLMDLEDFIEAVGKRLSVKFKPEIVEGNLKAIRRAYEEVKGL
ncbi:MAG: 2-oxoacid:acceptor oxidoreductase family protein [Candidatus Hydrothermae bacterium]|nr:2-oxoacid:acceptor oxidoreductase family protein [Candidatus Hydrothermae bacterium]